MSPSSIEIPLPATANKKATASNIRTAAPSGDPSLVIPHDAPIAPPVFEDKFEERRYLKHRLAIAFRIFAKFGFSESVAGHITLRDPVKPDCFWVNPFGLHFSLIEDSDLILVDHSGKVIDGGKNRLLNYAAFAIHSEIHAARPDVICAAHAHTTYGRAFSATGRPLTTITQDACIFHNDHILYPNFGGAVLASEEGAAIASALGSKKAAILGNHGLLVAGRTVEETVGWFVLLERCCMVQLIAEAGVKGVDELVIIGEEEARWGWEAVGGSGSGYFAGLPWFQLGEREFGERTFLGRGLEPA